MAAGINCAFAQVYAGLEFAGFKGGQTVVIQGAGGLGIYACAVAREFGASKIIMIDGIDERLQLARAFGADEIVDMRQYRTPAERIARVKALTDEWCGDHVLELVRNPHLVDEGLRLVAADGAYIDIRNINAGWEQTIDPSWLVFVNRRFLGNLHSSDQHVK